MSYAHTEVKAILAAVLLSATLSFAADINVKSGCVTADRVCVKNGSSSTGTAPGPAGFSNGLIGVGVTAGISTSSAGKASAGVAGGKGAGKGVGMGGKGAGKGAR